MTSRTLSRQSSPYQVPPRYGIRRFFAALDSQRNLTGKSLTPCHQRENRLWHVRSEIEPMATLEGKLGLVFGVANKRSIAWAIAQAWHEAGATLAFTYQGDRLKRNVEQLAATFGDDVLLLPCDVTSDEDIAEVFTQVKAKFGKLNLLLHSIAFAPRQALEGNFVDTDRESFRVAHDVSAYSLVAVTREAAPLMTDGGGIIAISYYGAAKVVPNYNVMGVAKAALEASTRYLAADLGPQKIRVNCISAGPMNTLAARGISGFTSMLKHYEKHAPLKRNVNPAELGATGVFLASDGAAAITGQVIYVDSGYQIMGM
ncbi:MAG: Enoyl-[acyl-carrier-protein] reductase [NADH] FabI [Verrucomicrobia subdivision 3 bacterium]|nr:Enoyl-[acyl-carrier-protein] reductase [NADH] FabI [Limisphaerales bacterium]MCS1412341.1 Enoyl-[acyl-carrier-protein] reductase [NADH] FabI [Limisphaerales bacterium]